LFYSDSRYTQRACVTALDESDDSFDTLILPEYAAVCRTDNSWLAKGSWSDASALKGEAIMDQINAGRRI
jgi:hypothetical protein